jgi:hypothetical protein
MGVTFICFPSHAQIEPFSKGIEDSSTRLERSMKNSILSESIRMSYFKSVTGASPRAEGRRRTSLPSRRKTIVATAASSPGSPAPAVSTQTRNGTYGYAHQVRSMTWLALSMENEWFPENWFGRIAPVLAVSDTHLSLKMAPQWNGRGYYLDSTQVTNLPGETSIELK